MRDEGRADNEACCDLADHVLGGDQAWTDRMVRDLREANAEAFERSVPDPRLTGCARTNVLGARPRYTNA